MPKITVEFNAETYEIAKQQLASKLFDAEEKGDEESIKTITKQLKRLDRKFKRISK